MNLLEFNLSLDKVEQIVVPGVSEIPGGIEDGTISGTNELFTGKGYTQNYLGEKGYNKYIATNAAFTQDDITSAVKYHNIWRCEIFSVNSDLLW